MLNSYRPHGVDLPLVRYMVIGLWLVVAQAAGAQSPPDPFERAREGARDLDSQEIPRPIRLKERLMEAENWTFYHSIDRLPEDMREVLNGVAGPDVVGPGEPMATTDIVQYPSRTQHFYTAVTDHLGVIVWFSGGGYGHAAIYDRKVGDACRYDLGTDLPPVLPLRASLRWLIHIPGQSGPRCEYLSPSFF